MPTQMNDETDNTGPSAACAATTARAADRQSDPRSQLGLRFDWRDWAPYLDDDAIPDDQKRELIETLWSIVIAFVDMGWSLNPTQQICGQDIDLKAVLDAAVLNSHEDQQEQEEV